MMCASFNGNWCTTIISCYSPTNASDETDIITFYNELSFLVQHIPKHNVQFISWGDMNAEIGKDENNKFCLNNLNGNEEYQADFSLENIHQY